jgi:hypothetical protein
MGQMGVTLALIVTSGYRFLGELLMSTVVVASTATSASADYTGQSFTPNVPGPNGTGSIGSATSATLSSITFGYPTSDTDDRAVTAYVHSEALDDPSDVKNLATLVSTSTGTSDANGTFGSGTYSRTFTFPGDTLQVSQKYYIYFAQDQIVCDQPDTPYSGGDALDIYGDPTDECLQFSVSMTV